MICEYKEELYLPELSKSVIYLDQFFFSHVFRSEIPEFVECAKFISELAHDQLIVCPRSSVHEIETHQWRSCQKDGLWNFIKRTSRGMAFEPVYRIKHSQILHAFERFRRRDSFNFIVNRNDALPHDINAWEDYFWIDVGSTHENVEHTRKLKEEADVNLINLFPKWRKSKLTFAEHQVYEQRTSGKEYIRLYIDMVRRIAAGDFSAIYISPIDTQIVESMLHVLKDEKGSDRLDIVNHDFFNSPYFAEVPYEYISTELITVLRDRVKEGQFKNSKKTINKLRGFFFDMDFISAYAPYCDAMVVDIGMLPFVQDKRLDLHGKYGVKFFARTNWTEFI